MKPEVKLLIVDDHPVFRRGLREIIEENPGFRIVGEASDGEAALRLVAELKPGIAVVDIDMPRLSGLDMMRALQKKQLPVAVVFLTMYKEEDMFNAAMDLGVKAYVLKENAADEIFSALEKVALGRVVQLIEFFQVDVEVEVHLDWLIGTTTFAKAVHIVL